MTGTPDREPTPRPHEISVLWLGRALWTHRRPIAYAVGGVSVAFAVILLLVPNTYTSRASILPATQQSQISELKSLVGLPSLEAGLEGTSELYPEILRSRRIKDAVLSVGYSYDDDGEQKHVTLQEYFDKSEPELLYRALDGSLRVDVKNKTGVIHLGLETKNPDLSRRVLTQYLAELENINRLKRNSKAADNARYLSEQLALQTRELELAEDSLESFRLANRNWSHSSSPEIVKNDQRLRRQVELKGTTVSYLAQEYEAAKFEAQKNTPILKILDEPSLPTRKSGPFRTMLVLAIALLTFLLASGTAVVYEAYLRDRMDAPGTSNARVRDRLQQIRLLRFIKRPATSGKHTSEEVAPRESIEQND